jgi:hypothetical protein
VPENNDIDNDDTPTRGRSRNLRFGILGLATVAVVAIGAGALAITTGGGTTVAADRSAAACSPGTTPTAIGGTVTEAQPPKGLVCDAIGANNVAAQVPDAALGDKAACPAKLTPELAAAQSQKRAAAAAAESDAVAARSGGGTPRPAPSAAPTGAGGAAAPGYVYEADYWLDNYTPFIITMTDLSGDLDFSQHPRDGTTNKPGEHMYFVMEDKFFGTTQSVATYEVADATGAKVGSFKIRMKSVGHGPFESSEDSMTLEKVDADVDARITVSPAHRITMDLVVKDGSPSARQEFDLADTTDQRRDLAKAWLNMMSDDHWKIIVWAYATASTEPFAGANRPVGSVIHNNTGTQISTKLSTQTTAKKESSISGDLSVKTSLYGIFETKVTESAKTTISTTCVFSKSSTLNVAPGYYGYVQASAPYVRINGSFTATFYGTQMIFDNATMVTPDSDGAGTFTTNGTADAPPPIPADN